MKGDFSRTTFNPRKHYSGVRMQQGRVQLDADWNENLDILKYRIETETVDVIGECGVPIHAPGFGVYSDPTSIPAGQKPASGISLSEAGDFWLTKGRAYVHGILCEIDETLPFSLQPHSLPHPVPAISESGTYLAYLDVWQRHITAVEDPDIREVALGGPDTATRTQTVWQVKLLKLGSAAVNIDCNTPLTAWPPKSSTGRLRARTQPGDPATDPCTVPAGSGYRRLENQLYRVEIHKASGETGGPTFKWSRDNGSIVVSVIEFNVGGVAEKVKVSSLGRDDVLGLHKNDWVEISDDASELAGKPGTLVQIMDIDPEDNVLVLNAAVSGYDLANQPKVRRWDSDGEVAVSVPSTNDGYLKLEDGVEIKFDTSTEGGDTALFRTGDYWVIPARTVPGKFGDIEWPKDATSVPEALLPMGIVHFYCKLAILTVTGSGSSLAITEILDCRKKFPPLTELPSGQKGCCTVTVGDGGDFGDLQSAIDARPPDSKFWHICLMPGEHKLQDRVKVNGMDGLTISGCFGQTSLVGKEGEPVLEVLNSRNVTLESLMIKASNEMYGVIMVNTDLVRILNCRAANVGKVTQVFTHVKMYEPFVTPTGPMFVLLGCQDVIIAGNDINGLPGVIAWAVRLKILANLMIGGGIQVLPGSMEVAIESNRILKGFGPGIQLGGSSAKWDEWVAKARESAKAVEKTAEMKSGEPGVSQPAAYKVNTDSYKTIGSSVTLKEIRSTVLVQVVNNLITGMAGSGIITTMDFTDDKELSDLDGLTVVQNRIINCALKPDLKVTEEISVGGGIVLTGVSTAQIAHNLIAENGIGRVPACGVFILDASNIDVHSNKVLENGTTLVDSEPTNYQAGIAAIGVVGNNMNFQDLVTGSTTDARTGIPALRIHDNQVTQPAGQALAIAALGTVSVLGNALASRSLRKQPDILGPWSSILDVGKCVTIMNFGQPAWTSGLGVGLNLDVYSEKATNVEATQVNLMPDGRIMFNDNQVSLTYENRPSTSDQVGFVTTSTSLFSLDDISVNANQFQADVRPARIISDVLVGGVSVRASGNFFAEPIGYGILSYTSNGSSMNITMGNQAVHCIFTAGAQNIKTANIVDQIDFCRQLGDMFGGQDGK